MYFTLCNGQLVVNSNFYFILITTVPAKRIPPFRILLSSRRIRSSRSSSITGTRNVWRADWWAVKSLSGTSARTLPAWPSATWETVTATPWGVSTGFTPRPVRNSTPVPVTVRWVCVGHLRQTADGDTYPRQMFAYVKRTRIIRFARCTFNTGRYSLGHVVGRP